MIRFFRKAHKWIGLFVALLILFFSVSGIILNHRKLLSAVEVSRGILPRDYAYKNWNNAAVKATLPIKDGSVLLYGNIGVWKTDSSFNRFDELNNGFPKGIDNRKIFKLLSTKRGLIAGTLFGLYRLRESDKQWIRIALPTKEDNVVDLLQTGDTLFILTRSHLIVSTDLRNFKVQTLPPPANYDQKVSLFKTLWVIHSGEIYGSVGKLLVDLTGVVFIFLSIGGMVLFFTKRRLKNAHKTSAKKIRIRSIINWNLKWHNKTGWIAALLLMVTTLTGMFLRPPLLIAIGESHIRKIPMTELDTPNPWFDMLRRIIYVPEDKLFIVSTAEGFYAFDSQWKQPARHFDHQPPASVMGVTVLEHQGNHQLMVGSFEGLFSWNYQTGAVYDLMKKRPYVRPKKKGPPVGDFKISGYSLIGPKAIAFDYDKGAIGLNPSSVFCKMPDEVIDRSPMSLWNVALECHTGRIFNNWIGLFYFLIVPLGGLLIFVTIISGLIVWLRHFSRRKRKATTN